MKEVKFLRRQTHGLTLKFDGALVEVDLQVRRDKRQLRIRRRQAPQSGANTCQEFVGAEWLHDVHVSPRIQSQNLTAPRISYSDHDHRHVTSLADLLAGFDARAAGHVEIHEYEVGALDTKLFESLVAAS